MSKKLLKSVEKWEAYKELRKDVNESKAKHLGAEIAHSHNAWSYESLHPDERKELHHNMMDPKYDSIRSKMHDDLATQVPTKNIDNERHFLLHRRHAQLAGDTVEHVDVTSYSTHPHDKMHEILDGGHIHSAWVPQSKISYSYEHALKHHEPGHSLGDGSEGEVIVGPGKYKVHSKFFQTSHMKTPVEGHPKNAWDDYYAGKFKKSLSLGESYNDLKKSEDDKLHSYDEVLASAKRTGNDADHAALGDLYGKHKPNFKIHNIPVNSLYRKQGEGATGRPAHQLPNHKMWGEAENDEEYAQKYAKKYPSGHTAEPILVRPDANGKHEILDGRHRARAAHIRGETHIRAFISEDHKK